MSQPLHSAWTSSECKAFDLALQRLGLPAICLMEQAAQAICALVTKAVKPGVKGKMILLCGPGNNGADGVTAARLILGNPTIEPHVFLLSSKISPDSLLHTQLKVFSSLGGIVHAGIENWPTVSQIDPCFWVDALFGVGLTRPIEGPLASFIAHLIPSDAQILAVDCPSGLDATTGKVHGTGIRATWTLSFIASKTGFHLEQGPQCTGEVLLADIGVRSEIAKAWKANQGSFPGLR